MNILSGYATYITAIGLLGLGIYQISQGHINEGIETILGALAAAGLRRGIAANQQLIESRTSIIESEK